MKTSILRVLLVWVMLVIALLASLLIPHKEATVTYYVNSIVQLLLFVTCVFLVKREPTKKNRFVFLNFSVWLGSSMLFHIYHFVPDEGYLRLFFFEYGILIYYFCLASSLGYLTIDLLFRDWQTRSKYVLTLSIVGGLVLFYFMPFIADPLYIYSTQDAHDYSLLQKSFVRYHEEFGRNPSVEELASVAYLPNTGDDSQTAFSSSNDGIARVVAVYPYLLDENSYVVLLVRPIYLSSIFVCMLCLGLVLLFFAYQYLKDPPQGAYVEKIMFLFLIFCTMEVLHNWSYVKSIEWYSFYEIMHIGQAISIFVLLLIGGLFFLRLQFITSPNGEFYEQEIATSPKGITRWRDMFDDLILTHFINVKNPRGRLFVDKNQVT